MEVFWWLELNSPIEKNGPSFAWRQMTGLKVANKEIMPIDYSYRLAGQQGTQKC